MKDKILGRSLMMLLLATTTIVFAQESKIVKTHQHPYKEGSRSEIPDSQIRRNMKRKGMGSIQAYNLHRQYHSPVNEEKHQIVKRQVRYNKGD
ncbi:hypothetical protein DBR11_06140 [Pedobacter sp. HMWF019]|uniref:hypothetical protein n=1 Tax=Pedobacter sp. HMWF019 TaxID=2056856 RepID=UPI000D3754FF|nr:hypothetical protein [Pedobacter sp. HMWF019]PTT01968.1 hypothetical protein DBR11_06140 [Pedobacter sp. HMWF019]